MRDRLIELLKRKSCEYVLCDGDCGGCKNVEMFDDSIESIADHLLAAGVIVPPCKVGSKIYMLVTKRSKVCLPPFTFIKVSRLTFYNLERVIQDFGKTVFLTREEAEQAMKGGAE